VGSGAFGRGYRAGVPHLRAPGFAFPPGAGAQDEGARAEGGEGWGGEVRKNKQGLSRSAISISTSRSPARRKNLEYLLPHLGAIRLINT